jgi:uncharacterized membrane protein YbaN (DUF454 family)
VAQVAKWARIIGGFGLIALGVVGLFLPFLQGIAFIVLGLLLLSREYHWARRLLDWVKRKRGAASPARD